MRNLQPCDKEKVTIEQLQPRPVGRRVHLHPPFRQKFTNDSM